MLVCESHFTPTQQRMMSVLSDGEPHTAEELRVCLYDEQGETENIHPHLYTLRKLLRPFHQAILCEGTKEKTRYRLVSYTSNRNIS